MASLDFTITSVTAQIVGIDNKPSLIFGHFCLLNGASAHRARERKPLEVLGSIFLCIFVILFTNLWSATFWMSLMLRRLLKDVVCLQNIYDVLILCLGTKEISHHLWVITWHTERISGQKTVDFVISVAVIPVTSRVTER